MTVRLAEALQELETDNRDVAIAAVATLLGAFPIDHDVRKYAVGCPRVLEQMAAVQPLSEEEAMKAVLRTATGDEPDPERYAGYGDRGTVPVSIEEIADRIRMVVRPQRKVDVRAERGALLHARMAMAGARFRRPMPAVRARGSY